MLDRRAPRLGPSQALGKTTIGFAIALVLGLTACAPASQPVQPLPVIERADIQVYLGRVADLNRTAQTRRIQLRWWVAGVPGVIWEGRGRLLSNRTDVREHRQSFEEWAREVQAFQTVPPSAAQAQVALEQSYQATLDLLSEYEAVLDEASSATRNGGGPIARAPTELRLQAARLHADQSTRNAESEMESLLRRFQATPSSG